MKFRGQFNKQARNTYYKIELTKIYTCNFNLSRIDWGIYPEQERFVPPFHQLILERKRVMGLTHRALEFSSLVSRCLRHSYSSIACAYKVTPALCKIEADLGFGCENWFLHPIGSKQALATQTPNNQFSVPGCDFRDK